MPFWVMLLTYVVTFLITELLRPKPDIENAKPATLGDFQVPTATEGRAIPLIFGRVNIKGPNVVWYGDLRTDKIEVEVDTGLFSSEDVTVGFEYYLGLQLALCRGPFDGPDDKLHQIRNDDSYVWGTKGPNGEAAINPSASGTAFTIDVDNLFGKDDEPGQGGLRIPCEIYDGSELQTVNSYLTAHQSPTPAYRGTSFIIMKQGWIGNSPQLRNFEFEYSRYPNGLAVAAGDQIVADGANPMCVLYEALSNAEWGLNLSDPAIDLVGLRAVAATLKTEGNGYSFIWDRPQEISAFIAQIEQQVDGILVQEPLTGIFGFTLVRDDYTPGTLPLLDESNTEDVERFKRPSWNSTANVVSIQFADRRKAFNTSYALAQDSANIDIVGSINLSNMNFPGVADATLANSLAWRELRLLSYPIATGRLRVNRTEFNLKPGDVRELSWSRLGLTRLPIRVTKINRGNLLRGTITIDFTEDIFAASAGTFSDPSDTAWTPPNTNALPALTERLIEMPFVLTDALLTGINTVAVQIGALVVRSGDQETGFNKYVTAADAPTIPPDPGTSDVIDPASSTGTTPYGLLTAALDRGQTNGFQDAVGFMVDNGVQLTRLSDTDAAGLENLVNGCLIDDEIILFSDITDGGAGIFTIFNLIRGALDTLPDDHLDNAPVWFFSYGTGLVNAEPEGDPTFNWKVRNQLFTGFDTLAFGSTTVQSISSDGRAGRGYPPRDVQVNPAAPGGGYFPVDAGSPSGAELVGSLGLRWHGSDKFTQARATAWDDAHVQQEAGVAFRIRIIEDPGGADTVVVDVSGIPSGASEGAFNAAGFADDTVTDLYQAEISSVSLNGESPVWTIGPFNIYGFGYKMDEKFGGDNDGILLAKGDPPNTVDPVPGVTAQSIVEITAGGVFDSDDDIIVRLSFLEVGTGVSQNEDYFIIGTTGGKSTVEDYLVELAGLIAIDFDPVKIQAIVAGNVLTISTSFGSLGGTVQNNTANSAAGVIQETGGNSFGQYQVLHFDLWESAGGVEVLAPNALVAYNSDENFENTIDLQVEGLTKHARDQLPEGGLTVRNVKWGGREISPGTQAVDRDIPLRDGEPIVTTDFDSSLLSQLEKLIGTELVDYVASVNWNRYEPVSVSPQGVAADRPGVEVRMRQNFIMTVADTYDTAPQNTEYAGLFGPVKLLGKDIVPAVRADNDVPNGFNKIIRIAWTDERMPTGPTNLLTLGQIYTVLLGATTFTETVIAGDVSDGPYRDGIYNRFKVQIDASAGGSAWEATLNTAQRPDGSGTYVTSMDVERFFVNADFDFDAGASFGLTLDINVFEI